MPTTPLSIALAKPHKEPLLLFDRAADQLPVMLSVRQYGLLILAVCVLTAVLLLPSLLALGHGYSFSTTLAVFVNTSLAVSLQMSVNLLLRYADTPMRRQLEQRWLWLNVLVRVALGLSLVAGFAYFNYKCVTLWAGNQILTSSRDALAGSQVFGFVVVFIQLAVEASERSQYLTLENERLLQQRLQARYEGLKQQLSPHFLFNSLSTLGSLIDDEPAAAKRFVSGMSVVYRYLLRHGEQLAVPLHEELAFVRSYCYLLQTRFGESLQFAIDLPEAVQQRLLPPLALQLLVENAVKHNVLTARQPLCISIAFQEPDTLVVRNTLRPRLTPEASSGVGLSNLADRLRMLHHRELLVEETGDSFYVYVPLPACASGAKQ